jgi:hypothetical protein
VVTLLYAFLARDVQEGPPWTIVEPIAAGVGSRFPTRFTGHLVVCLRSSSMDEDTDHELTTEVDSGGTVQTTFTSPFRLEQLPHAKAMDQFRSWKMAEATIARPCIVRMRFSIDGEPQTFEIRVPFVAD